VSSDVLVVDISLSLTNRVLCRSIELTNLTVHAPGVYLPLITTNVALEGLLPRPLATYGISSCSNKLAQVEHHALGPAVDFSGTASEHACLLDMDGSFSGKANNYVYAGTELLLGDFECTPVEVQIGTPNACQCLLGKVRRLPVGASLLSLMLVGLRSAT